MYLDDESVDRVKAVNLLIKGWGQYFRVGTSTAKFEAIDRFVVQRFAVFLRNKHQWRALGLSSSRVHEDLAAAGLYRLSGTVRYSGAMANARR
ncbi:MAG: hypothetical protein JO352_23080 [Chloroflexi bacterium]|nr:hypothetical protein [Chloroflexota bacterium]MBV9598398.1 hypothetical protein [Chloroflexota bacterium]